MSTIKCQRMLNLQWQHSFSIEKLNFSHKNCSNDTNFLKHWETTHFTWFEIELKFAKSQHLFIFLENYTHTVSETRPNFQKIERVVPSHLGVIYSVPPLHGDGEMFQKVECRMAAVEQFYSLGGAIFSNQLKNLFILLQYLH